MHRYKLLVLFIIGVVISTKAQSVEELITMAKSYNPELKSINLEQEAARSKVDQVNDWPDPKVNLGIGVLPIETRLGPQIFKIGASQEIPWKGLLNAKSNVERAKADVLLANDDLKEIDIEYAIRTAYAQLQLLVSSKDIVQERLQVLEILTDIAKSGVRSGNSQLSNVLLIERKREALEADLLLLDNQAEQVTIMLNRWSGRNLNTKILLEDFDDITYNRAAFMGYAENAHPRFEMLDNKIKVSNSIIDLTTYQAKPKISVGAEYAYVARRRDVEIAGNGRDVFMPMGSISIPLHTGRFDAIRQEERIKQEALELQKSELRDQFRAEIEVALKAIQYADQLIVKNESLKEITRETIKLIQTEYASEGSRFEELLELEMELIDYDYEILKAKMQRQLSMAILYKYK